MARLLVVCAFVTALVYFCSAQNTPNLGLLALLAALNNQTVIVSQTTCKSKTTKITYETQTLLQLKTARGAA